MATVKGIPSELKLYLASSTGKHYEIDASEVYVELEDGVVGVLPGHQPEFYSISAGFVEWKSVSGEEGRKLLFDGFVQIEPDVVRIGVHEIYEPGEVDVAAIEAEVKKMEEQLSALTEEEEEARKDLEKKIKAKKLLIEKAR